MFITFFYELKKAGVPVSLTEFLAFLRALSSGIAGTNVETFYFLARTALVKDERLLDKFDLVFGHVFRGLDAAIGPEITADIPEEWLRRLSERVLTDEEKAQIEALGGWDKIMEELKKRLDEQKARHQGGSKWIGTGGTSPFGAYGYNPEGVRIGQDGNRNFRAVKVWDKRDFKDLDGDVELGTRGLKLALRRLRQFARQGAADEIDIDTTVRGTAHKGYLDLAMRPEKRNTVKVLLFFDVGGSMDYHVRASEELFSAARSEFKHMDYFYFHNCMYESVWRNNARRWAERVPTLEILQTYPEDYKVIFVGDAAMSPYEVVVPGGSVEHHNEESGQVWLARVLARFRHVAWLNPMPERYWEYTASIKIIQQLFSNRMYPLTLDGIERAITQLARRV